MFGANVIYLRFMWFVLIRHDIEVNFKNIKVIYINVYICHFLIHFFHHWLDDEKGIIAWLVTLSKMDNFGITGSVRVWKNYLYLGVICQSKFWWTGKFHFEQVPMNKTSVWANFDELEDFIWVIKSNWWSDNLILVLL